ncbi:MORN motif [Trypanosoma melophagium]|uniref:MORN motif n=1 Tax=Trypanosoma melophagium TaxID=715481 RepID=UPI00351A69C6|nr:MORN motif [Trypanosoma melophagium]
MVANTKTEELYEYLKKVAPPNNLAGAVPVTSVRKYIGALDDDHMFHGEGVLISEMGFRYEGVFLHGSMEGHGRITWSSGITYEGEFKNNAPNGKGIFLWVNGDRYVGEVRDGVRYGHGELSTAHGVYTGEWVCGKRHGMGRQTYAGNSYYEGEWIENKRNGKGKLMYPNGDLYDGMWHDDKREGFGTMGWKFGTEHYVEVYEGEWRDGIPFGFGRSTYVHYINPESAPKDVGSPADFAPPVHSVLNVYVGEYLKGKRHGFGVFYYADGSIYEGEWRNGNKDGRGKCTANNGVSHYDNFHGNEAAEQLKVTDTSGSLPEVRLADIIGVSDNSLQEATSAVRLLLLRFNNTLKDLFYTYSGKHEDIALITTPSDWWKHRPPSHIFIPQYLRLLNDAHIINGRIGISDVINCVALAIEKEEISGEEKEGETDNPWSMRMRTLQKDILHLQGYLNYRQFAESLVRLSAIACIGYNIAELSRRFSAFIEGSLVKERFEDEPLCPLTREWETFLIPHLKSLETLFRRAVVNSQVLQSSTSALLGVQTFIAFFRGLFEKYDIGLTEAVNYLFPFDQFKTPGLVPSAVCQPRNALGLSLYEKSCGPNEAFAAVLVASEKKLTFVEFIEAILGVAHLMGATNNEEMEEKLLEIFQGAGL